jgi:hypothetical protein
MKRGPNGVKRLPACAKRPIRGISLATVLIVAAVASIAAFTFAGLCVYAMNLAARAENAQNARNLAESAAARALESILASETYGTLRTESVTVTFPALGQGSMGFLSFNMDDAKAHGVGYSTNNLSSDAGCSGWRDATVPRFAVHLVAIGTCNGVTHSMETIFHRPPFPYVVASSGRIVSPAGLQVAAVKDLSALKGKLSELDSRDLLPGSLASNSTERDAVTLGPDTEITGDIQASGGVKLIDPQGRVVIRGAMRQYGDPVPLPEIDITAYDPKGKVGTQSLPASLAAPTLEGRCRRDGDLTIGGDLKLDGALLYVDGNLTVSGGVTGKGAVIVLGKTTINGACALAADNEAALLSRGDVVISGRGKEVSAFSGVVYTGGSFKASALTLVGAFIANDRGDPGGGGMELDEVNLVHHDMGEIKKEIKKEKISSLGIKHGLEDFSNFQYDVRADDRIHMEGGKEVNYATVSVSSEKGETQITITHTARDGDGNDLGIVSETFNSPTELIDKYVKFYEAISNPVDRKKIEDMFAPVFAMLEVEEPESNKDETYKLLLKPNKFLNAADTTRLLLWRKL